MSHLTSVKGRGGGGEEGEIGRRVRGMLGGVGTGEERGEERGEGQRR